MYIHTLQAKIHQPLSKKSQAEHPQILNLKFVCPGATLDKKSGRTNFVEFGWVQNYKHIGTLTKSATPKKHYQLLLNPSWPHLVWSFALWRSNLGIILATYGCILVPLWPTLAYINLVTSLSSSGSILSFSCLYENPSWFPFGPMGEGVRVWWGACLGAWAPPRGLFRGGLERV